MPEVAEHLTDDRLQEWLDGELAPDLAASARAHVSHCARCTEQASKYRMLYLSLERLDERKPSVDLTPGVLARLVRRERRRDGLLWVLAGQAMLAGFAVSLTWPRLTLLADSWRASVPQPQLLLDFLRAASQGLRLTPLVLPWDSLRNALELPSHWGVDSLLGPWPAWGAALGVGFVIWTGVNGWMLRTGGVDSAGASPR
jgi:anti-sigma factor RsiW